MSEKFRKLNSEESALPWAKYYDFPEANAAPEVLAAFDEPISPDAAILPENINEALTGAAGKAAAGYCLIPSKEGKDGGYITFQTFFPNVDGDALKWWYCWRALASANFLIANSAHNHSIAVSEADRAKLQHPGIPLDIKLRGTIQVEVKEAGIGSLEDFIVHFVRPEDMELDVRLLADTDMSVIGGWWTREDRSCNNPYKKAIDMFLHVCREKDGGVEVSSYYWVGYRCLKGKNRRRDAYGPEIDLAYVKAQALAAAQEQANLAAVLPPLYAEFGGQL